MKKFNIGDRVRVVNYGHIISYRKTVDILPGIIGKTGVITGKIDSLGEEKYSIDGIKEKSSWYTADQLEIEK